MHLRTGIRSQNAIGDVLAQKRFSRTPSLHSEYASHQNQAGGSAKVSGANAPIPVNCRCGYMFPSASLCPPAVAWPLLLTLILRGWFPDPCRVTRTNESNPSFSLDAHLERGGGGPDAGGERSAGKSPQDEERQHRHRHLQRRQADGDVGNDEKRAQAAIRRATGKRGALKENGSRAKLKNSLDSFLRKAPSLKTQTGQKNPALLAYDRSSS